MRISILIAVIVTIIGLASGIFQDALTEIASAFSRGNLWTFLLIIAIFCVLCFLFFVIVISESRRKDGKAQISSDRLFYVFVMWGCLLIFAGLISAGLWILFDEVLKGPVPSVFWRSLLIICIVMVAGWLILRYVFLQRNESLQRRVVG